MLDKKYQAQEAEKKWQDYWKKTGIYKFRKDCEQPVFSIDTPPPTVNGKIHIGHIFSYSQAEFIARYKRIAGHNVFYPFGFDDNGLPTERLAERQHGIKAHETTREHFTGLCLEETGKLEEQFRELFISAGFSCDWDYEYSTISRKAQITSQKSFLELYRDGKVYYTEAPALWCTECRTAIAQAELETKDLPSTFNYLKFYIEGMEERHSMEESYSMEDYIEIATTRPELLASCQCIFIHPEDEKNKYLLERKVRVPLFGFTVPVLTDEKVEREKGSGMVMCCTFGDLTDLEWYKEHSLSFKESIRQDGTMSERCGKYQGMKVVEARKAILRDLEAEGYLIRQEEITHNVAVHERCGTPMEISIKKQWFIDIMSNKQQYLAAGEEIHWYPEHMKARYRNWVENLEWDWCISRQRFYGVPFPVWYCRDCGRITVAKEKELPVNPLVTLPEGHCECGSREFLPEKDIMDTWATSSVTPLINLDWYDSETYKEAMMPMSLRPNAHDIIRTWDFYTIVKNLYHTGRIPWKNVMISGFVMASPNEKISKRKENSEREPAELIAGYSADAVRMWAATGSLGNDIVFSEGEFVNAKKLITKLWNAAKFILMHLEGFEKRQEDGTPYSLTPYDASQGAAHGKKPFQWEMDRWILLQYNSMLEKYTKYLEKYEVGLALGEIEKFFWNFCDDYIEIVKTRLYQPEIYGEGARKSGLHASCLVFLGIIKCFSIYIPHVTEEIYQNYFADLEGCISIHVSRLKPIEEAPGVDAGRMILQNGNAAIEIIRQLRRYKSENALSLKEELAAATVRLPEKLNLENVMTDIKATCSLRELVTKYCETDEIRVRVDTLVL